MEYIKYVPLILFSAFAIKALVVGATLIDAPILLVLGAIAAFYEYKAQEKKISLLQKRCDTIDTYLTTLTKNDEEIKTYISGLKLGQVKTNNVFNR